MIPLAVGYQYIPGGENFASVALSFPEVKEVYFPWPEEPSGRPRLGHNDEENAEELAEALQMELRKLRAAGVRLDLLLNANCYGSQAMSVALERHVAEVLETLNAWGCLPEVVTTASPFVARTVKTCAPAGIDVRASVNMRLGTIQALAYLAPLFDSFYIQRDVQRNLETVKRIHDWCAAHGKKLGILANSGCLRNCPWQTFHDNLIAHSAAAERRANADWNPHLCWTLYREEGNFPEILKATWIRPEDLNRYEGLVDFAKLATRQHASPRLVIGAYARRSFDGNLLDLLEPGFAPAFGRVALDNKAFPSDWAERVGACPRECTACGYCEDVFRAVACEV